MSARPPRRPQPRVAVWGSFDVEDAGQHAIRRVVEVGLRRRLPEGEVTAFAPLGAERPLPLDGGRPAEPLGTPSQERRGELAARFDLVLVAGDVTPGSWLVDGLGAELEALCPVEWAGVSLPATPEPGALRRIVAAAGRRAPVAVLEAGSWRLLAEAGVPGEVTELPPLGLLLPGLLGPELPAIRLELQRLMAWAWPPGPVLSVHGDRSLLGSVGAVAGALLPLVESGSLAVQLAASGRDAGEEEFACALEAALGGRCRRLPGVATLEDLVAAVSGSAAFLGPPGIGLWVASALGVPAATPSLGDDGLVAELGIVRLPEAELSVGLARLLTPDAPRARPAAATARLEAHLDAAAGRALAAAHRRGAAAERNAGETAPSLDERLEMLRRAHEARGSQIFEERAAFEAVAAGLRAELERSRAEYRTELERMRAALEAARRDNDLIVGSRTWRYSQPVRDTLARLRERRR